MEIVVNRRNIRLHGLSIKRRVRITLRAIVTKKKVCFDFVCENRDPTDGRWALCDIKEVSLSCLEAGDKRQTNKLLQDRFKYLELRLIGDNHLRPYLFLKKRRAPIEGKKDTIPHAHIQSEV